MNANIFFMTASNLEKPWLNLEEVAQYIGRSRRAATNFINKHNISKYNPADPGKLGKGFVYLYERAEIDTIIRNSAVKTI